MAALVVALLVLVHTPPVARWSRDWLVRQVADTWQLDLATSRVDYNLYTGRVSFADVRLAAPGHADAPFFAAARVTGILPWSIVRGPFRVSRLEVEAGRVLLVRENGVIVNLPPSSGAPPPETARFLDLRGLQLRGLDVDYVDRTGDVDVQVRDLRADLGAPGVLPLIGPSGPITAASIMARIGERATASGAVAGRMSFDGSNLVLEKFTAPFPEATVVADGRINRVLDDVRFALSLTGSLDLAAIAAWTPPPVPVSGPGTFTGTFSGPLGGYELRATFGTSQMTIARVPEVTLAGVLTLTSPRAVIEPLTITTPPQGGTARRGVFEGAFIYLFGDPGGSDLTGTYRDFDLDMALALYDQDAADRGGLGARHGQAGTRFAPGAAPAARQRPQHAARARRPRRARRHLGRHARRRAVVRAPRPCGARHGAPLRHGSMGGGRRTRAHGHHWSAHARHLERGPGRGGGAALGHRHVGGARRPDGHGPRRSQAWAARSSARSSPAT